jgi:hypothetical protein
VADVLNGAADLIERDGWVQRQFGVTNGPRCISGALLAINKKVDPKHPAYRTVVTYLGLGDSYYLSWWNDAVGRTEAEVVTALRAAAECAA